MGVAPCLVWKWPVCLSDGKMESPHHPRFVWFLALPAKPAYPTIGGGKKCIDPDSSDSKPVISFLCFDAAH